MNPTSSPKTPITHLALALALITLNACGGSSSGSSADDRVISGVALTGSTTGAPLANTSVEARCAEGNGFDGTVMTDNQGRFSGRLTENSVFPCAIRANHASFGSLHSLAVSAGTTHLSLLTDLGLAYSGVLPTEWFDQGDLQGVADTLASREAELLDALKALDYPVPNNYSPFRGDAPSGGIHHQLNDLLLGAIDNDSAVDSYDTLLLLVRDGVLASLPSAPAQPNGAGTGATSALACFNPEIHQPDSVLVVNTHDNFPTDPNVHTQYTHTRQGKTTFMGVEVIEEHSELNSIGGSSGPTSGSYTTYWSIGQSTGQFFQHGRYFPASGFSPANTMTYSPPIEYRYDLLPGESHSGTYTVQTSSGTTHQFTQFHTTTFHGFETLTLPLGTVRTCKFTHTVTQDNLPPTTVTYWVAEQRGVTVQNVAPDSEGRDIVTTLTSATLNGNSLF